jgi:hypothetical protein
MAYLGNEGKCSWSAKFLFDRQKVVIADRCDRERWERYFEPWISISNRPGGGAFSALSLPKGCALVS